MTWLGKNLRTDWWFLGALSLAIAAFCFPVVLGQDHIPYDFQGYNFPLWKFIFDNFRQGAFPLFDRFTYSGVPFLSESNSGLFYPLNGGMLYLASWWLDDLSASQVEWINGLHMFICGAGVYVLARIYGASPLRALAIAVLVIFSGRLLGEQQHPGVVAQYAWVPWLLVAIERIIEARSFLATVSLAAVIAMVICIGFFPLAIIILLLAAIYALSRLVTLVMAAPSRDCWEAAGLLVMAAALGGALSAPTWLPFLEFLPDEMAVVPYGPATLEPFATTVFPNVLGHFSEAFIGSMDTTKSYYFAGPGFWLALAAVILARGSRERCLQVVLVAVLLFAFGPVHSILSAIQSVPLIGQILRPESAIFLIFLVPFLLLARQPHAVHLRWLAVIVGWSAGALTLALMFHGGYALDGAAIFVGCAWLVIFSTLALGRWRGQRLPMDILLVMCGMALFIQHTLGPQTLWRHPTLAQFTAGTDFVGGRRDVIAALRKDDFPYRIAVDQEMLGGPFNSWWRVWRMDSISGMEPTLDGKYARYLHNNLADARTDRTFGRFRPESPAFKVLNVRFLLTRSPRTIDHPDWTLVFDQDFRIYEYRGFVPRFRVTKSNGAASMAAVKIVQRQTNRWVVKVDVPGPGHQLLVAERWNDAWQAEVNGHAQPVQPFADGMNLCIDLPTGVSSIRLDFRSVSLTYALALASFAVVVIIMGMVLAAKRRHAREPHYLLGRSGVAL